MCVSRVGKRWRLRKKSVTASCWKEDDGSLIATIPSGMGRPMYLQPTESELAPSFLHRGRSGFLHALGFNRLLKYTPVKSHVETTPIDS